MPAVVICPRCSSELPSDAPEGLCPECLLLQAIKVVPAQPAPAFSPSTINFVPPTVKQLAQLFPQLEVLEFVGQGGMGAVYKARQPALDRLVAIKVLPPEAARDPAFAERFTREARSLARVNHANIVTIYDFGENAGYFYIIMEYVAGKNLRQLMQSRRVDEATALRIVCQVCDALDYAHEGGIVHRDIKPENILLDARGQVRIADFGLAKLIGLAPACLSLTNTTDAMGTVYYMAPEQLLRAHSVDHRADLYSLGVVFYEMLTGELPVGRFAPPSRRAPVDARLDAVVLRALEPDPAQRYQNAIDIKREIEDVLNGRPILTAEPIGAATVRPHWPCVRFTIPKVTWMGAWVDGEMYRDDTHLILDFNVISAMGIATPKSVRIPLTEMRTISCHAPEWPGLPRWMNAMRRAEVSIKVFNPDLFADLPAGQMGWGRLQINRGDRGAAQQLVESILRHPLLGRGQPRPTPTPLPPSRGRRALHLSAIGLILSAVPAFLLSVLVLMWAIKEDDDVGAPLVLLYGPQIMLALWLMITGGLRMLSGRSYTRCVAGAVAAILPWSPAWLITAPLGLWSLTVLSRREVIHDFLGESRVESSAAHLSDSQPVVGKLQSWFGSFAKYFVTVPSKRRYDDEQS